MGHSARLALLAIASAAFALIAVELTLRWLGPGPVQVNPDQQSFWVHDPMLGWRSRASHHGVLDNGFFRVEVTVNSRGLRGPERGFEKPSGKRRVVVAGDSFAWGFGVSCPETLAERLEQVVPGIEVINGGVSGYSTDQAFLWLREEGVRYGPDLVVYLLSGNDDVMNHMQVAYWIYYKPSFHLDAQGGLTLQGVPVPRADRFEVLRHSLRSRSALARSLEVAWMGEEAAFVHLSRGMPDPVDPHRLTVALVDEMARLSRDSGAAFVVVASRQYWFSPNGSPDQLSQALRAAGHTVIDVEAEPGWQSDRMHIPGDGHWNAEGHAFASGRLAGWMQANLDWARPGEVARRQP